MQKITVEITAKGFTGLTAENIKKALDYYFGAQALNVSFSVKEVAQQSAERTFTINGVRKSLDELTDDDISCIAGGG